MTQDKAQPIGQRSLTLPGENDYNSDEVKYGKPEPRNQPGSANTSRDFQRRGALRTELPAETATQSEPVAEYRIGSGDPDYPTDGKVSNEAEKVGNDRTGSGRSGHSDTSQPGESSDDSRLVQGGDDVANRGAVSNPKKAWRSPVSKVLKFPSLTGEHDGGQTPLLTGEQRKSKRGKQKTSALLLTGEQAESLKAILPSCDSGFWWDAPADDKGFKIKLRWRDGNKKQKSYVFARLGKHELNTLRKGSIYEQRADLYDRLTGELIEAGRSDLAERIKAPTENNQRLSSANSAIA